MKKVCAQVAIELPSVEQIRQAQPGVCPVAVMREIVNKAHHASCGLGIMCRDGLYQLHTILNDIAAQKGESYDINLMTELCEVMVICNECELSVSVAKLVLASLEAHREEWDLHIHSKECSALICFYKPYVAADKCVGCGKCAEACPEKAILGGEGMIHVIKHSDCTRCGICETVCPEKCILRAGKILPRCPEAPIPVGTFTQGLGLGLRKRRRPGSN